MATHTAPSQWWEESAETLATVYDVLDQQGAEVRKAGRKRGR